MTIFDHKNQIPNSITIMALRMITTTVTKTQFNLFYLIRKKEKNSRGFTAYYLSISFFFVNIFQCEHLNGFFFSLNNVVAFEWNIMNLFNEIQIIMSFTYYSFPKLWPQLTAINENRIKHTKNCE